MSAHRKTAASAATLVLLALAASAPARADTLHLYSYDPADADTRAASGALTFEVRKGLLKSTVLGLMATEAKAGAQLRRASPGALGGGGLFGVLGPGASERDLYEVLPVDEGPALVKALCPGSKRAWLAFGKVRFDADLKVDVIGDRPAGGARLCHTLAFSFHGEWIAPPTGRPLRERDLPHNRYPGT